MVGSHARLVWEYFKINLATSFEYRASFFAGVFSMVLNDIVWLIFWALIFSRFSAINGWTLSDVLLMYAIVCLSFGITGVFFGQRGSISPIIETGALDFYLTQPKNVILHLLVGRLSLGSMGDALFGAGLAIFTVSLAQLPLFLLLTLLSTSLFLSFGIIVGSLAFFLGRAQTLERNLFMSAITFGTYPFSVFSGFAKFILLTLIPVGFISGIPVQLLRHFDLTWFIAIIAATIIFLFVSVAIFNLGLRRYESGNLITDRV